MNDPTCYLPYNPASLLIQTEGVICILGIRVKQSSVGPPSHHPKGNKGIGHWSDASLDDKCAAAPRKNNAAILLLNTMFLILVGIIILKTNHTENAFRSGLGSLSSLNSALLASYYHRKAWQNSKT